MGLEKLVNLVVLVVVETIQISPNLVEIDNHRTVALLFQIKDILVELDMVFLRVTLDLLEVVVVLMLPERMGDQLDQQ